MKPIHPIQAAILEKLLFTTGCAFSDLKVDDKLPSNQLAFHINALIDAGLLHKGETHYSLTTAGKEYANSKDSHSDTTHKFQKVGTIIIASRERNGTTEYLLYTRKKHPFFGKQGFPTGKVRWGEKPIDTASREITEEAGLTGDATLIKTCHFINKDANEVVIEDKYLFVCHIQNPDGEIVPNNEGDFFWVPKDAIPVVITDPFDTVEELLGMIDAVEKYTGESSFTEKVIYPEGF